jgi:glycosyltransferase involved in cell wall biosynthesis
MKAVVVVNKPLTSLSSGYDLRVWHLCGSLLRAGHGLALVVVPLGGREAAEFADGSIDARQLFEGVYELDGSSLDAPAVGRHFRTSERDYLRLAYPRLFASWLESIRAALRQHAADRVLFFGENLAGLAEALRGTPALLDVCDSAALTLRRQRAVERGVGGWQRFKGALDLLRWERLEGALPAMVQQVTTISEPDSDTIRQLAAGAGNIVTVPNGVAPELEQARDCGPASRRGVVFWGNLSFAPNREAVRRFHDRVFAPWLSGQGVEWCIVGRNAEPWLVAEAARNPRIRLTGFVTDLYPLVSEYPVMVNPLYSGSGLKNKVLEAFALGLPTVSTQMGVEAIEGAVAGTHFLLAEDDEMFARQVLQLLDDPQRRSELIGHARQLVTARYTWCAVGAQWQALCEGLA